MNQENEKIIRQNVSSILSYLRIEKDISQDKMSKLLDMTRPTYLRLEKGQKNLAYSEWLQVKNVFDITEEELELGFLDRSPSTHNLFNLPAKYREDSHTKGRLLNLFIECFVQSFGQSAFIEFCEKEKISQSYFTNLSNPINIRFPLRIFQELILKGELNSIEKVQKFAKFGINSKAHHGDKLQSYSQKSGIEKLYMLVNNIKDLEENHEYVIEDLCPNYSQMTLSFKPKDHVDMNLYAKDPVLKDFSRIWISNYFHCFAQENLIMESKENFFSNKSKNTFTYKVA